VLSVVAFYLFKKTNKRAPTIPQSLTQKTLIQINESGFFYVLLFENYNPNAALTLSTKSNFSQVNNSTVTVFGSPFGN
jgi:hypothetical protein